MNSRSWILYFYNKTINCTKSRCFFIDETTAATRVFNQVQEPPWTDMEEVTVFVRWSPTSRSAWRSIRQSLSSYEIRYPWDGAVNIFISSLCSKCSFKFSGIRKNSLIPNHSLVKWNHKLNFVQILIKNKKRRLKGQNFSKQNVLN